MVQVAVMIPLMSTVGLYAVMNPEPVSVAAVVAPAAIGNVMVMDSAASVIGGVLDESNWIVTESSPEL
jgi:dolichol kinase